VVVVEALVPPQPPLGEPPDAPAHVVEVVGAAVLVVVAGFVVVVVAAFVVVVTGAAVVVVGLQRPPPAPPDVPCPAPAVVAVPDGGATPEAPLPVDSVKAAPAATVPRVTTITATRLLIAPTSVIKSAFQRPVRERPPPQRGHASPAPYSAIPPLSITSSHEIQPPSVPTGALLQ